MLNAPSGMPYLAKIPGYHLNIPIQNDPVRPLRLSSLGVKTLRGRYIVRMASLQIRTTPTTK